MGGTRKGCSVTMKSKELYTKGTEWDNTAY